MRSELDEDFVSRAFVVQVLEVLRLLCEGHNQHMQVWQWTGRTPRVVHNQGTQVYSID